MFTFKRLVCFVAVVFVAVACVACLDLPIQGESGVDMGWIRTSAKLEANSPGFEAFSETLQWEEPVSKEALQLVLISDAFATCDRIPFLIEPSEGHHSLALGLTPLTGDELVPGLYSIQPEANTVGRLAATFFGNDVGQAETIQAYDGIVNVDAVEGERVSGSLALRFGEDGKLNGVFDAGWCEP